MKLSQTLKRSSAYFKKHKYQLWIDGKKLSIHLSFFNMKHIRILFAFAAVSATLLLSSCGGSDTPPNPNNTLDRQPMLINWVDNIIIPSYDEFKLSMDGMTSAFATFEASPSEGNLASLRAAWVEAYTNWQKVELFQFGPADVYDLRSFFNIYPANLTNINTYINDPSLSLDLLSASSAQGFPALDYMLNGAGESDAAIVAYYTAETDGPKRLAFAGRVINRMNTLLGSVISQWNGTYRDTFINSTGLDIGSAMGKVVNAYVLNYERYVRSGKIAIPSGSMLSGMTTAYPDKVEAYYKEDISLQLAKAAHKASVDFFNGVSAIDGTEGPSFKSYLDALGAKDESTGTLLSEVLNDQFDAVTTSLDGLDTSFVQQIANDNSEMYNTYIEMQKAVVVLKVDMASAMSIIITYTDNDGD